MLHIAFTRNGSAEKLFEDVGGWTWLAEGGRTFGQVILMPSSSQRDGRISGDSSTLHYSQKNTLLVGKWGDVDSKHVCFSLTLCQMQRMLTFFMPQASALFQWLVILLCFSSQISVALVHAGKRFYRVVLAFWRKRVKLTNNRHKMNIAQSRVSWSCFHMCFQTETL